MIDWEDEYTRRFDDRYKLHEQLRAGRERARNRLIRISDDLIVAFQIGVVPTRSMNARMSSLITREIEMPWPTTTRVRIYRAAELIAPIIFDHRDQWSRYLERYEAQVFAHRVMRLYGLKVPPRLSDQARADVYDLIGSTLADTKKLIDPSIAAWAVKRVPPSRVARRGLYDRIQARVIGQISVLTTRRKP